MSIKGLYILKMATGLNGVDVYADTSSHAGDWGKLLCVTAAAFTSLTGSGYATPGTLTPGMVLWGRFSEVQLSSGEVHMYRNSEG